MILKSPRGKVFIWNFFPVFAGIPFISSRLLLSLDGMKTVPASYKHNIAFSKKWLYAITIIIIRKLLVLINQSSSGDLIYFDNKFFDKAKEPDVYEIKKRTLRFQRFFIFLLFFFYFYFSRKKVVLAE